MKNELIRVGPAPVGSRPPLGKIDTTINDGRLSKNYNFSFRGNRGWAQANMGGQPDSAGLGMALDNGSIQCPLDLTPGMITGRMITMIKQGMADMELGTRKWRWRLVAATTVFLLLSVQIGLAGHNASHLHGVEEAGDCSLCVLGSHFVAEFSTVPNPGPPIPVETLSPENPADSTEPTLRAQTARGPPAVSV